MATKEQRQQQLERMTTPQVVSEYQRVTKKQGTFPAIGSFGKQDLIPKILQLEFPDSGKGTPKTTS